MLQIFISNVLAMHLIIKFFEIKAQKRNINNKRRKNKFIYFKYKRSNKKLATNFYMPFMSRIDKLINVINGKRLIMKK